MRQDHRRDRALREIGDLGERVGAGLHAGEAAQVLGAATNGVSGVTVYRSAIVRSWASCVVAVFAACSDGRRQLDRIRRVRRERPQRLIDDEDAGELVGLLVLDEPLRCAIREHPSFRRAADRRRSP
jgi:hypothetical protein